MSDRISEQYMPGKNVEFTEQRVERLERMVAHLFRALHEAQASNKAKLAGLNSLRPRLAALESRLSDEQGSSGTEVQGNQDGRNNGVSSWKPLHHNTEAATWSNRYTVVSDWDQVYSIFNHAPLVEWGVNEARVNWGPPKPGTHESDLGVEVDDWEAVIHECDDPLQLKPKRHPNGDSYGGEAEYHRAAVWSRENAR